MDIYKTVVGPSTHILFKDRKSKFYGYCYSLDSEAAVKPLLAQLRKKHPAARHFCYAWQLGTDQPSYRVNDDGEPKNTGGTPIYGQLKSFGVTNAIVIVVREFGGVKLGASRLSIAYKTAARMALEEAIIEERPLEEELQVQLPYPKMDHLMRLIKHWNVRILAKEIDNTCTLKISLAKDKRTSFLSELKKIQGLSFNKPVQ